MINFDDVRGEIREEQNAHWLQNFEHPYKIQTVTGSRYVLLNLINFQPNIDKIFLYPND